MLLLLKRLIVLPYDILVGRQSIRTPLSESRSDRYQNTKEGRQRVPLCSILQSTEVTMADDAVIGLDAIVVVAAAVAILTTFEEAGWCSNPT